MEFEPFSLALSEALSTANGEIDVRNGFLVTAERSGACGFGEATPLAGWTEPLEECRRVLETIADGDASVTDIDPDETPAARHGVELATVDANARAEGVPLAEWLADSPVDSVPVNATIGDADVEETVRAATVANDAGFDTVKIKVGARSLVDDRHRVEAVADALPSVDLRLDANGAWSRSIARTAIDQFASLGVTLVEQPLEAGDLTGHAALRGHGVEITLDESVRSEGLDAIVRANAADVVVLKPMVLGGVKRTRALALEARDRGLDPVVTTTIDGVLARTAALHLAASLDVDRACGLATADRLADDLAPDPAPVSEGRMTVPELPGLGVRPGRD
ncbi:MAG: mandelate racemase/muconate lactonizing enzyme family protein [Halorhabdus sp.]